MSVRLRLIVLFTLVAGVTLVALRVPLADAAVALVTWIRGAGVAGALAFAAVYIALTVALVPGSVLTLGAGFAYGPLVGTLVVSPVSVAAATTAFLLGRTAARPWIARRMAHVDRTAMRPRTRVSDSFVRPHSGPRRAERAEEILATGQGLCGDGTDGALGRFQAVDRAVGREGFKIVALLRLSPLFPFTIGNYALGLTRVRLRDYVLASWIGMLPGTVLYVYLGSLLTSATDLARGAPTQASPATRLLYWGGLVATALVVWLITRTARRSLPELLAGSGSSSATGSAVAP